MQAENIRGETVLVTGAGGSVGPSVVRTFLEGGWRVRALVRRMPDPGVLPLGTEIRLGDVCDEATVEACMARCAAAVHVAGRVPE